MNRLVIIGNGFDLAHGLPTRYKDFIDDYWENIIQVSKREYVYNDGFLSLDINIRSIGPQGNYELNNDVKCYKTLKEFISRNKKYCTHEFKNKFFKSICDKSIENWVDVEACYYSFLKDCIDRDFALREYSFGEIELLNKEFEKFKVHFERYLIEKVEERYVFSKNIVEEFMHIFNEREYEGFELEMFFMEMPKKVEQIIKKEFEIKKEEFLADLRQNHYDFNRKTFKQQISIENHFLSFNYTCTAFNYIKALNMDLYNLNEIHGRLKDERNPINFGFGDEMDKHYQEIEEKNDNEYLRNIKSFQYLHTPNYKSFLNLIDSDKFQVYIMGHSCGLSDRTLLNTIFEHENCCSIKVFYHEIKDESGKVIRDNYTEITQNISRHFSKKALMRENVVNKTLCQPLPQIQLPLK